MSNYLDEFKNPSSKFRGAPFWAWNCKLKKEQLLKQLDFFHEMGLGGATIHCRTGLATTYLGNEFMDLVQASIDRAKELGMLVYLYDEDRWPSGFGGGEVTKKQEYRSRYLVFTKKAPDQLKGGIKQVGSSARASMQGNGKLLAAYEITLKDGYLCEYRRLQENESGKNVWYAYLEVSGDDPWYNNQSYVDTLNKEAIKYFLQTTHEKYKERFGEEFGKTIPSIFTDEPQFVHKTVFGKAENDSNVIIPYTDDFDDTYFKEYGTHFLDILPEIFWELPDGQVSVYRYRYHDHLAERFATAYADTIGQWCNENHIALTGHMMEEPTLASQTHALGEAMRQYRGFLVPGIDILCDRREFTTAKQAQSAAHQMGSNEMTSELYGVTNWDFDLRGHKLQGDWQAALGVTHRVHHLSWVSMEGEAKRDYPASISYQSPWADTYHVIEDYFARVNTALMSGKPEVKIGVLHPIESYWLYYGPEEQTANQKKHLEMNFENVTDWMLTGLLDFDYISESLWNSMEDGVENNQLKVGKMKYEVIVVPELVTFRSTTITRLQEFVRAGGTVIFMGQPGTYVDAKESSLPAQLYDTCIHIPFEKTALMDALSAYRQVDVLDSNGIRSNTHLYQLRADGENKILFIANANKNPNKDIPNSKKYQIQLTGEYIVEELHPLDGRREFLSASYQNKATVVEKNLYEEDSVLLYLYPKNNDSKQVVKQAVRTMESKDIYSVVPDFTFCMSEPNAVMLDQAEFSLDSGAFEPAEEVLRLDNVLRERLHYPLKMEAYAQPWTRANQKETEVHKLVLRYSIKSDIALDTFKLATEPQEHMKLFLNGKEVTCDSDGFYVDESIKTYPLSGLVKGNNELLIQMDYHRWSNLEWSYLLGNFGVKVYGRTSYIVKMEDRIEFGDLCSQGLPFYGGNVSYQGKMEVPKGHYAVQVPKYRAPLIEILLDGEIKGYIFTSPSTVDLGTLTGTHTLEIKCYGNRVNTFGSVHNCNENTTWFGPGSYRTQGNEFSYEYQLKRTGILRAPNIIKIND